MVVVPSSTVKQICIKFVQYSSRTGLAFIFLFIFLLLVCFGSDAAPPTNDRIEFESPVYRKYATFSANTEGSTFLQAVKSALLIDGVSVTSSIQYVFQVNTPPYTPPPSLLQHHMMEMLLDLILAHHSTRHIFYFVVQS